MKNMATEFMDDIITDIDAKPPRIKIILKWVIRASVVLIAASFVFGQVKMSELNRLDNIEVKLSENFDEASKLRIDMRENFNTVRKSIDNVNIRIDKVYDDGVTLFNQYQQYNEKQFELIIDYGYENKELLKKMITINNSKQRMDIETQIIRSKLEGSRQITNNGYINKLFVVNNNDTIHHIIGATLEYIENIDIVRYTVNSIEKNIQNEKLYDIIYENRQ